MGEGNISHQIVMAPLVKNSLSEQETEVSVSRLWRNFGLANCGLRGTRSLRSIEEGESNLAVLFGGALAIRDFALAGPGQPR